MPPSRKWKKKHGAYINVQRDRYTEIYEAEPLRHPYHPDERHYINSALGSETLATSIHLLIQEEYVDRFIFKHYRNSGLSAITTENTANYIEYYESLGIQEYDDISGTTGPANGVSQNGYGLMPNLDKEFTFGTGTQYVLIEWLTSVSSLSHSEQASLLANTNKVITDGQYPLNRIFLDSLSLSELQELEDQGYIDSHLEGDWNHEGTKDEYKNNLKKIRILHPIDKVKYTFPNTNRIYFDLWWLDKLPLEEKTFDYTKYKLADGSLKDSPRFSRPAIKLGQTSYISPTDSSLNYSVTSNSGLQNPTGMLGTTEPTDEWVYYEGKDPDDDYFHANYPIYPLPLANLAVTFRSLFGSAEAREIIRMQIALEDEISGSGDWSGWFYDDKSPFCCDLEDPKKNLDSDIEKEHDELIALLKRSFRGGTRMNLEKAGELFAYMSSGAIPSFNLTTEKITLPKPRRNLTSQEQAWIDLNASIGVPTDDPRGPEHQFMDFNINLQITPKSFYLENPIDFPDSCLGCDRTVTAAPKLDSQGNTIDIPVEPTDLQVRKEAVTYEGDTNSFVFYSFDITINIKSQYPEYGDGADSVSIKGQYKDEFHPNYGSQIGSGVPGAPNYRA